MSKNELDKRLGLMSSLGVTAKHQQYLIDSANDDECKDFIKLVDELSSAALWMADASSDIAIKKGIERHLETRKRLIIIKVSLWESNK